MDNRISLYVAQNGKCAVTKRILEIYDIHCHHIVPLEFGGTDEYGNLIIIHADVHRLIHASTMESIATYINRIKPDDNMLKAINKLREVAKQQPIAL